MFSALVQALFAFVLTGIVGAKLAHGWQARASKETRFFEASKDMYQQMVAAADQLSDLAGRRLYASQRLCLVSSDGALHREAVERYKAIVLEWNERLLTIELSIRTKFRNASLYEFENLQNELSEINRNIESFISRNSSRSKNRILNDVKIVRAKFFQFTQSMMKEAQILHRQMHFGVKVPYEAEALDKMSTQNLIKLLFTSRIESQSIVRSPTDFGLPVNVGDARFGIHE
jgi:hypothetical protein